MPDDAARLHSGEAWRDWCRRLEATGERILESGFPQDARGRAEGVRALTRLLVYATQMEMEAGDPLHPVLYRYGDPRTQWGGPNPDNVYLRATVDPSLAYRVRADVTGVRDALFSLHEGDMQLSEYGVFSECALHDLEVQDDGSLEIHIAPDAQPGNWMRSDPKARLLMIRVVVSDWERDVAPFFHIERIGAEGVPPPPPDAAVVARALDRSAAWVETTIRYWNDYLRKARERATPNRPSPPRSTPGGADHILYGSCFFDLAPDEALLLTCEVPDASYWSFALHTPAWFESGDFAHRQTSLSSQQAVADPDGRLRLVLAHDDPGTPNWIDTESRREGLLTYRFVGARSRPVPEARVLPLDDVAAALPDFHPRVDPAARRASLARRSAALWSRYR
jgi:hypothetical protein